uniref:Harbinger transposase-derived protein n=1 Tax=Lactuca sativa TaxID=4236 RepID=A0A9R1UFA5_LACSA|nr:hypothetical protein LSAT_V11C900498710 [Lactuca sativa]
MHSGSDDDLVLHTLLSVTQDVIRERGETSHRKKKQAAHELLVRGYFSPDSLYDLSKFEECFYISRNLFLRITSDLERNYEFFQLRLDARGKRGFTTIQKCTAALRQLRYGITADASDEYLEMSERTGRDGTYLFYEYVIELYRDIYLRHPTKSDVEQLYVAHEAKHGFPGMLGSIDCIHWEWANCPNAWCGQFTRRYHGVPTVILEAVVSNDLWFWHAFFDIAGSNNDLNGKAPYMSYVVNGNEYKYGYYLGDEIYPECHCHIIEYPTRTLDKAKLTTMLTACVILHNMIIQEKGRTICSYTGNDVLNPPVVIQVGSPTYFSRVLEIQNHETHHNLRHDLTEHIWGRQLQGGNDDGDEEDEGDDYNENAEGNDEADEDDDDDVIFDLLGFMCILII